MPNKKEFLSDILPFMLTARAIDILEQEYTARGEAFFHVSGRGHEGIAVIQCFLDNQDWVHAHYRDKSLLLSRGVTAYEYFLALFNKDESHSRGRQMNSHMSSPPNKVLSLVGPVGNSQSQAAGIAASLKQRYQEDKSHTQQPIVISGVGDGTTAQGEFLEGLTLSIIDNLPLLTVIEDNNLAISTKTTGKTFFQVGDKPIHEFMGCPITRINGRNPEQAYDTFERLISEIREQCEPRIVIFDVDRLDSHTNADDQKMYRTKNEIEKIRVESDPIISLMKYLYDEDNADALKRKEETINDLITELRQEVEKAQRARDPQPIFTAKAPPSPKIEQQARDHYEEGDNTMIMAVRNVLDEWLKKDARVILYGEDLEDPKGDVFGVTKGLSTRYPGRVVNSLLSESLIVGSSVGRALAGQRPVAFLQFADFFPLIVNQVYSELGSMYWRSDGKWQIPVIVMATSGGYKPGLGPFHAATMEAMAAHIPGVDVFSPSNAADAAGLLNAAFLSERPTIFFYPKNLLNTKTRNISESSARTYVVKPGVAQVLDTGTDISLVGYGNTMVHCENVAATLKAFGKSADVIDLRTISPLDHKTIGESVHKTKRLLVAHEENGSMGVGAEVIARISEIVPQAHMKRLTRKDTFIPCNFPNQLVVLPSYKELLETAVDMIGGSITWSKDDILEKGIVPIEAVGSSPSDETFTIVEWKIKPGDTITSGDLIAEGEANKAEVTIKSIVSGTVQKLLYEEGDEVPIGKYIALIQSEQTVCKTVTKENPGTPEITWNNAQIPSKQDSSRNITVHMGCVSTVLGKKIISNQDISLLSPEWDISAIESSTGIVSRHWIDDNQDLISMSVEVARKALQQANIPITDINGIICATGTNDTLTPSLAAIVQYYLIQDVKDEAKKSRYLGFAFDVSAACAGYVFALSCCYDRLRANPREKLLLLTGEVLSKRVDMNDYQTAPVFSDAATATIIASEPLGNHASMVEQPIIQTLGEPAKDLVVPGVGYIHMNGVEVYKVAVEHLKNIAELVCKKNNISITDVDLIVPHQANIKIIRSVARRMKIDMNKFFVNIDQHGNSSSNTVPICLAELQAAGELKGKTVLVIVFGGGYTFAGTLLRF